ncbi:hypothetical protein GCM10025776_18950 [Corallincola platygyrae]
MYRCDTEQQRHGEHDPVQHTGALFQGAKLLAIHNLTSTTLAIRIKDLITTKDIQAIANKLGD